MKIGEFCRIHQISPHTIWYYIQRGLLVPELRNKQYVFTESCARDMTLIERFKLFGFSLQEIHEVLSLYRITNFTDTEDIQKLVSYLDEKERCLLEESRLLNIQWNHAQSILSELHTIGDCL